jgi:hypothetical protein
VPLHLLSFSDVIDFAKKKFKHLNISFISRIVSHITYGPLVRFILTRSDQQPRIYESTFCLFEPHDFSTST